jgi:hypothetical protein
MVDLGSKAPRSKAPRRARVPALLVALATASGAAAALAAPPPRSGPAGPGGTLTASQSPRSTAAWPPIDEQLARDHVKPGSQLEKLIRANQDFNLLRPDEARDGNPLPPWLRVLWRKGHPQGRYSASDPSGGYPLVLQEVHVWMLTHQDLQPAAADPPRPAGRVASETAEQRISGAQQAPRSESDIRVNPYDPTKIIAASNNITSSGLQAIFYSTDGGASWGQTYLPRVQSDYFHSDPAVEWTSDGTAWSTTIGVDFTNFFFAILRMRAYKSTDHGQTWSFDDTFSGNEEGADKELIWADHSASSPFKDNLYAIWHDFNVVVIARRTGPGGSWQHPIEVSGVETTGTGIGADVTTNAAGGVFGFWPDTGSQKIYVVKSTDGGASFGAATAVAATFGSFQVAIPSDNYRRALIYVSAGTFKGAGKNNVYASWNDLSGEGSCTAPQNAPFSDVRRACKSRIWFSRSTDGGATWSPAAMINNLANPDDQFFPRLTVDPASGRLAIVYYDTIKDAGRLTTNLFYQSSTDDGTTWSTPFQVTTASTDETEVYFGADYNQYGDYIGLSSGGGGFHPTWTDRRGGKREEIWSSNLADPAGGCTPPAAPAGLTATPSGAAGVALSWGAVGGGATYQVLRSRASGGPYSLLATTPLTSYFDSRLACDVAYYYVVRAVNVCESAASNEVSPAGRAATILYSNDFESGSGLADWEVGYFYGGSSNPDWRGIQTCTANSGTHIFRFGGASCTANYGSNDFSFAQPNGSAGIAIPDGANGTKLSFWHRRDFEPSLAGGLLALSSSASFFGLSFYFYLPPEAIVEGATYDGFLSSDCPTPSNAVGRPVFTGTQGSFVNTVVDIDAACKNVFGFTCAGGSVGLAFTAVTGCAPTHSGWFLDDVTVSTCAAPPPRPLGFYTLTPCRLVDTRNPPGPAGGPALQPGKLRAFSLAGSCAVPETARALSVNVTVVQPAAGGQLVLFAADQPLPYSTVISFSAGQVRGNNAVLSLSTDGQGGILVNNQTTAPVQLLIDVNGYFQ